MQTPPVQLPAVPHAVPFGAAGFEQVPLVVLQVPATWHASLAMHTTGALPTHVPAEQASVVVQALASSQSVPFGAAGFVQTPVVVLHVPATWHASLAVHTTGALPTHVPEEQASVVVQALASSQDVPLGTGGFVQMPVVGSHEPTAWH